MNPALKLSYGVVVLALLAGCVVNQKVPAPELPADARIIGYGRPDTLVIPQQQPGQTFYIQNCTTGDIVWVGTFGGEARVPETIRNSLLFDSYYRVYAVPSSITTMPSSFR